MREIEDGEAWSRALGMRKSVSADESLTCSVFLVMLGYSAR